ncbi:MAG TPA: hypothetical protein VM388_03340 [Acidimicrobiales bacterium]|nr:hypothetical protein [Acidimicrobiales bacterium]
MAGAAPVAKAVVAVVLVAGLASCSRGDGGDSRAAPGPTTPTEATTTSSAPPTSSTTAVAPTTVTSRPPTTAAPSPEAAARSLYDAWARGDRAAAGRVGEPAAVTTLFGRTWQAGDGWAFSECTGAAGSSICTWSRPGGQQVLMRVGNAPASVTEVRFQP